MGRQSTQLPVKYVSVDGEQCEADARDIIGITLDGIILKLEKGVEEPDANPLPHFKVIPTTSIASGVKMEFDITLPATSPHGAASPKIHIVVSTMSGTQLAVPFFERVLQPALGTLHLSGQYDLDYTRDANSVTQLTEGNILNNANDGQPQIIVLLSGDGGVVDMVNALLSRPHSEKYCPPEIALIPMGTGNALAHSSGVTADNTFGLSTLVRGRASDLPLFRATFSPGARLLVDEARREEELPLKDGEGQPLMYGAVVCSWGVHAGLVADSDTAEYRKFGVKRFSMAAKEALYPADGSEPHRYKARVSLLRKGENEWTDLDRAEHTYVLSTLVSNLEKGFTISPDSTPLGGTLRVIHFGPMSGDEVMRIMTLAYQDGKHVQDKAVAYDEVEGIRIAFESKEEDSRWRRICVDGKIVRVEADGWVEVRKESQQVLKIKHLD